MTNLKAMIHRQNGHERYCSILMQGKILLGKQNFILWVHYLKSRRLTRLKNTFLFPTIWANTKQLNQTQKARMAFCPILLLATSICEVPYTTKIVVANILPKYAKFWKLTLLFNIVYGYISPTAEGFTFIYRGNFIIYKGVTYKLKCVETYKYIYKSIIDYIDIKFMDMADFPLLLIK